MFSNPLLSLFLFLHVFGAIAVFGPTFVFPIMAAQVAKMPQHGPFAAVLGEFIERRLVIPGAIIQGITGVSLILILGISPLDQGWRWLAIAIVLYLIAIGYAITVQAKAAERMVHLTAGGPPPGPPPAGAPAGPPPEIAATAAQLARGGQFLSILIVLIIILMVTKPSF